MRPPGPTIVPAFLIFTFVMVVEIINPGGIRRRLSPSHDRFLERLPPHARLAWILLLLTLGVSWVAMSILGDAFWGFVETPLGWVFGCLFWVGLIIVFVSDFTARRRQ